MPTQPRSYIPKFRLWSPVVSTPTAMSTPPRKQSAPAAVPCDWKGDPVEPEFDDLANQHRPKPPPRPEDPCHWMGDPAEPEEDDLAYQHAPRPKPPPPETGEPEPTPLEPPVLPAGMHYAGDRAVLLSSNTTNHAQKSCLSLSRLFPFHHLPRRSLCICQQEYSL